MPNHPDIAFWRTHLKASTQTLADDFNAHLSPTRLFKTRCNVVDALLLQLWRDLMPKNSACLIAVGGYGRKEFYPHSDVDLLILLPENQADLLAEDSPLNQKISHFIGILWDIGLHVGHSVRSLAQCLEVSSQDITVQTNMMEARLLTGNRPLYRAFNTQIRAQIQAEAYYQAKTAEQLQRHRKFNDTTYNLEPNVKESPGGLRDLHVVMWVARALNVETAHSSPWNKLVAQQIITKAEARQIKRHEKNIQSLRIRLHFLSGRCEDRLLFDFQNELAQNLGFSTNAKKRASEQLMQSYYRSAKFVRLINEIMLKAFGHIVQPVAQIRPMNAQFEAHNTYLEIKTPKLLQQHPALIFEAFLLLQQHPELTGIGANLLRHLQRVKKLVNQDFRKNNQHKQMFIKILSQPNGVNHALRAMNRYDILGNYIPAFGKIIGQMQHDLFHVYTVDEHILNVLANLRRFAKPELKHEFPLCSQLFTQFEKPHLLYLAALFHDIAKGRGGDHSALGQRDAYQFCRQHHLPEEECALVAWLVGAHLTLSSTAQKSDLSDPSVIENFAHLVKNERRLTALYLLTVADIRGTSPAVWNAWKAKLLESLFLSTRQMLKLNSIETLTSKTIAQRKQETSEKLQRFGLRESSYTQLWAQFGTGYFSRFESDEMAWQSRLLTPHLHSTTPIIRARLSPAGDGIQVMIYTPDQHDLFARICDFFDRMAYSIVEAKIYTTQHRYALDQFLVLDNSGKSVSYSRLLKFIETELSAQIDPKIPLKTPLQGRIHRQIKHMPIHTKINISPAPPPFTQLEIISNDVPGLLAKIAHLFLAHRIDLHNAKINTLGNRVEDSFIISAANSQALSKNALSTLMNALHTTLGA